jgi:pyruvate dehydrogenase E2 component (dihydrolipoamide acetyltransferase)
MILTLGCDHRAVDGARGALFLKDLAAALEEPAKVLG